MTTTTIDRRRLETNRARTRRTPHAAAHRIALQGLALVLVALCLGCPVKRAAPTNPERDPDPASQIEWGWLPGPGNVPEWAFYELDVDVVYVDGDMGYPLAELRAFQADVVENPDYWFPSSDPNEPVPLAVIENGYPAWPNGVIPYDADTLNRDEFVNTCFTCLQNDADGNGTVCDVDVDGTWDQGVEICDYTQRDAILEAMAIWEAETDIDFVEWTNESHRVDFTTRDENCTASVGFQGWLNELPFVTSQTRQFVRLSGGCNLPQVIHELGHTIGLRHEDNRRDRDEYIEIVEENLKSGFSANSIPKRGALWGEYDYQSVMQKPDFYQSKPCMDNFGSGGPPQTSGAPDGKCDLDGSTSANWGFITLVPRIPLPASTAHQGPYDALWNRQFLSKADIAAANAQVWRGTYGSFPPDDRVYFEGGGHMPAAATDLRLAYVDSDDVPDLIAFIQQGRRGSSVPAAPEDGDVLFALGRGDGTFEDPFVGLDHFCLDGDACAVGDVDGDGYSDVVRLGPLSRELVIARGWSGSFQTPELWGFFDASYPYDEIHLGDVNGDCKDDALLVKWWSASGIVEIQVAISTGNGFEPNQLLAIVDATQIVGFHDLDGDARDDLLVGTHAGDVVVLHVTDDGLAIESSRVFGTGVCPTTATCRLADINGDGAIDLVALDDDGMVYPAAISPHQLARARVTLGDGTTLDPAFRVAHELDCKDQEHCVIADFDMNGMADIVELGPASTYTGTAPIFLSRSTVVKQDNVPTSPTPSAGCVATPNTPTSLWSRETSFEVSAVAATEGDVFALRSEDGQIVRRLYPGLWTSSATVEAGTIVATDDDLYFTPPWGGAIYEWTSDTSATSIGVYGYYTTLYAPMAGPAGLFSASRNVVDFFQGWELLPNGSTLRDSGWSLALDSDANAQYAVGGLAKLSWDDADPEIALVYRRNSQGVWRHLYEMTWERISTVVPSELWAGGEWAFVRRSDGIFARSSRQAALFPSTGSAWQKIGFSVSDPFVADASTGDFYRSSQTGILRWAGSGATWERIGPPATNVFAAQGKVYMTSASTGELFVLGHSDDVDLSRAMGSAAIPAPQLYAFP